MAQGRPTTPAQRLAYGSLRRLGHTRASAARVVGVSAKTGARLDAHSDGWRCPVCASTLNPRNGDDEDDR